MLDNFLFMQAKEILKWFMLMTTIQTLACPQIYHQYYHVIWPNFDKRIFANLIQKHYLHLVTHVNDSGLEQISEEFCEF